MGRPQGWVTAVTGRPSMRSPGRPPVHRELEREFWLKIAQGLSSEDAAVACSVSPAVGGRWFRQGGGMPRMCLEMPSGRFLNFADREVIALLRAQRLGVREIARRLGRSPSTISREVRRNAATRGGQLDYRASVAQWKSEQAARRPKVAKLADNDRLQQYVQDRLAGVLTRPGGTALPGPAVAWGGRRHGRRQDRRWARAWSPEQIARRLPLDFPDDASMRVPTRRSTRRCTYRAVVRCVGSSPRACARDGRCASRARSNP